jgi:hypothetical protein
MELAKKVVIEVMYKADYCLPCFYMDQTVNEVLPSYSGHVVYHRVDFMRSPGKERFLELSCCLYGEDAVRKYCRVAPVPSLFIDGELMFDTIPPVFELTDAIDEAMGLQNHYETENNNSISDLRQPLHLEVIHEGPHCMPCEYMAKVVEEVAPEFGGALQWEKVLLNHKKGAGRFDELAHSLGRLPPVPSIFIDGKLVFDHIPGPEELRDRLRALVQAK